MNNGEARARVFELYGRAALMAQQIQESRVAGMAGADRRPLEEVVRGAGGAGMEPPAHLLPAWRRIELAHETVGQYFGRVMDRRRFLLEDFFRFHRMLEKSAPGHEAELIDLRAMLVEFELAAWLLQALATRRAGPA